MSEQTYQPTANRMIRNGCTRGMLLQYLEKEGLREHEIARIIKAAIRANSGRQRIIGFGVLITGLAIVAGCFAWINLEINVDHRPSRIAFGVGMFGLMIAIAGLVRMVSVGGYE